jgi:hypothetical protein
MSIKAGDLVYVKRGLPACGCLTNVQGMVFVVSDIKHTLDGECIKCGTLNTGGPSAYGCPGTKQGIDLCRLIKLDDPSLPEGIVREKELVCR